MLDFHPQDSKNWVKTYERGWKCYCWLTVLFSGFSFYELASKDIYLDKVNNSHLKVLYTNANGLYGKLGQLRLIVESDAIEGGGGQPHFTSFGQPKKTKLGWGKMR